jgi:hypothetical protein
MDAVGTDRILDLCSGGGGPWLTLQPALARSGPARVTLSDLYPNADALRALHSRSQGQIDSYPFPVDATNVPAAFEGVRTMFSAFHHFAPDRARAILADAVAKRRAIAIFEATNTRAMALLAMPLQLPAMLLLTPFVQPFRWSRLALTYVCPLIPAIVLFDGVVSFLRLYLEDELRELVVTVPGQADYDWAIGTTALFGRLGLTHLVGVPRRRTDGGSIAAVGTSTRQRG